MLASAATSMVPATLPKTIRRIRANTEDAGLFAGFPLPVCLLTLQKRLKFPLFC